MRTKRDINILKFVEEHGSITIDQCSNLFFKENKYGYDQARKRLSLLKKEGFLKRYRKDPKSQSIYYIEKPLKIHDLKLIDIYVAVQNIVKVRFMKELKREMKEKTYVLDGALIMQKGNKKIPCIVEIDYTHYTSKNKIDDVIEYYETRHNRPYVFIIVKLTQEEVTFKEVGKWSSLYIIPWDLKGIDNIIKSLLSNIESFESKENSY